MKLSHFLQLREENNEKILILIFCFKFLELLLEGCFLHNDIAQMQTTLWRHFLKRDASPSSVYKISILTFLILCTKFLFHIFFLFLVKSRPSWPLLVRRRETWTGRSSFERCPRGEAAWPRIFRGRRTRIVVMSATNKWPSFCCPYSCLYSSQWP